MVETEGATAASARRTAPVEVTFAPSFVVALLPSTLDR